MLDTNAAAEPKTGGIEIKQPGYTLYLIIPDTCLECRCSYIPNEEGLMITREGLTAALQMNGVLEGIDQEAVDDFIINATAGRQQLGVLLASGTPPVDGIDGFFTLTNAPEPVVEEDEPEFGDMNMYNVVHFVNVLDGDEIGRITPATMGAPGRNLKGEAIPQQPGTSLNYTIGKNIRVEENGLLLMATETGRFCQLKGEFSVEQEYVVKGNVSFNVGTIDFKGVVTVSGDVLDNFDVTATKGLTIRGNIGVCSIVSDGNISFCGMDGQEKGKIVCGGTLRAQFIHDTDIECAGDVIVDVEIHNCNIRTLGRVVVNKDTISGGSCIAQGGIESKKLGSASSRRTNLLVGVDYRDFEELKRLLTELTGLQQHIKEACSLEEITGLRLQAGALSDQIAAIRTKTVTAANAKINVRTRLYENVRMEFDGVTEIIQEQKDGPISIIENNSEGGLRFLSLSNLDVKAADLELAILREERNSSKAQEED